MRCRNQDQHFRFICHHQAVIRILVIQVVWSWLGLHVFLILCMLICVCCTCTCCESAFDRFCFNHGLKILRLYRYCKCYKCCKYCKHCLPIAQVPKTYVTEITPSLSTKQKLQSEILEATNLLPELVKIVCEYHQFTANDKDCLIKISEYHRDNDGSSRLFYTQILST